MAWPATIVMANGTKGDHQRTCCGTPEARRRRDVTEVAECRQRTQDPDSTLSPDFGAGHVARSATRLRRFTPTAPAMLSMPRRILTVTAALLVATVPALGAQQFDVMEATIPGVHAAIDARRLTCRALVQAYLDRIAAYDKQGPALNAIQHINARALAEADSLDAARTAKQPRGSLHCVPVLLKDQIETIDMPTTYGSAIYKTFTPKRDATAVKRLEAAGAIIIAKTTMGEFAGRYVGSAAGIIRNAYDPTRNPSGSSGGSASAVAANFGLVGIGEDTGGSIRGPAAVSSLVGLRPTLQLVSRFGMLPANPTQDTMGPMTRTVADAARVLDVIAGYDANDPITAYAVGHVPASYTTALKPDALRGARIGVMRFPRDTADPRRTTRTDSARAARDTTAASIAAARRDSVVRADSLAKRDSTNRVLMVEYAKVRVVFDSALATLRARGAIVIDSLPLPPMRSVGNDFETEAATDAYFAQHPNAPVKTLAEIMLAGTVNPWRARAMISYLGKTTDDPGYLQVIKQREALRVAILKLMADRQLDAIVYATYDAAPTIIAADVLTNPRTADAYGRGDNRGLSPQIGFPALTVPMGFTSDALPVGLEFLGRPFSEPQLFGYGFSFEQATRARRPPRTTPALGR
jgi:Asp-tRNA(Asn)/Glu-tRNA(Gln) amidotransferase A subunit family amidase